MLQLSMISRPFQFLVAHKMAAASVIVFAFLCLVAVFAPVLAMQNPYDLSSFSILDGRLPPGSVSMDGTHYVLGTDNQGRDMLSAILYGLRISLVVGLLSSAIAMIIGTLAGLVAGYSRGWVDALIMRIVDIQLAIPSILLALIMLAVLGRGPGKIIFALAAVQWVYFARTVRGSVLVEREKDYVNACMLQGFGHGRIIFKHLLPNVLPAVSAVATVSFAAAISLEATLSFLGVGMPITEPSLGLLISNGFARMLNGEYWISIFPGIALLVTVVVLNIFSDELQDILNPLRR